MTLFGYFLTFFALGYVTWLCSQRDDPEREYWPDSLTTDWSHKEALERARRDRARR